MDVWNRVRVSVAAGALLLAAAVAQPTPTWASTTTPSGTVQQYYGWGTWSGYGGLPWTGNYYPGSGLAAWSDYGSPFGYSYGYGVPSYGAYSYGYPYTYSYPYSYSYSPTIVAPYYGSYYGGGAQVLTPNGTSFTVCPFYSLYC